MTKQWKVLIVLSALLAALAFASSAALFSWNLDQRRERVRQLDKRDLQFCHQLRKLQRRTYSCRGRLAPLPPH